MNSMIPKSKAKTGKKKTDKNEQVAKSKAVKLKLNKTWLASAAKKASASPFKDQLVRVCDEQSSKRAFGIEGKVLQHSLEHGMVLVRVTDSETQL